MANISPSAASTAAPGQYVIFMADGTTEVISGTADDLVKLYTNLVDPKIAPTLTYVGYGWVAPADKSKYPVTKTPQDLLPKAAIIEKV